MKHLLLYAFGSFFGLTSCIEESHRNFNAFTGTRSNVIELIAFGSAAKPSAHNKGFGLAYYIYLNLNNDSVFFLKRIAPLEDPKVISLAGIIPGIAKNDTIENFLEATRQLSNGNIVSTNVPDGVLYCKRSFYSRNNIGNMERFHYFNLYNLDNRFKLGTEYLLSLQVNKKLRKAKKVINEDSIIYPIVNYEAFNFRIPPIPVKSTVKFKEPKK